MTLDQANFRQVLSQFASGVVVLTVKHADICHGMTVSSFCSLSLEPPMVLVCVNQISYCLDLIEQAQDFGINILDESGEWLSRHFATRSLSKFNEIPYRLSSTGVPLLAGALATIECRLVNRFPGGDHVILTGEVNNATIARNTQPLIYFRRDYKHILPEGISYADLAATPASAAQNLPVVTT
ncbi:MAG: flavin reductase [Chloroflexi bacterium]|jgi:flavin reductase (DIM6/NTAB) family NADH-FMN oxidoreductase RutF|nr:flavin reductase [Chloroflexota bacterium]